MKSEKCGKQKRARRESLEASACLLDEAPVPTVREDMFPFVRRAIERVYSRTGTAVSRDAVVAELLAMPETRTPLREDAARRTGSGRLEWAATALLLSFDQRLITGRLPEYEEQILRITGHRGVWTYLPFYGRPHSSAGAF